ncbi:MAG: hypothetical protein ACREE0_12265 [Phenylobacterium sp.]|jgi:hypothetical protein
MLKPGGLPIDMGGGVFDHTPYNGSLAAQIEAELNQLLFDDGMTQLPLDDTQDTRERRRLFVAIARGVVRHLRDNAGSIDVKVNTVPVTAHPVLHVDGM